MPSNAIDERIIKLKLTRNKYANKLIKKYNAQPNNILQSARDSYLNFQITKDSSKMYLDKSLNRNKKFDRS